MTILRTNEAFDDRCESRILSGGVLEFEAHSFTQPPPENFLHLDRQAGILSCEKRKCLVVIYHIPLRSRLFKSQKTHLVGVMCCRVLFSFCVTLLFLPWVNMSVEIYSPHQSHFILLLRV